VQFVLLVKVNQSLIVKHAEVALPLRFLFWVKNSGPAVHFAI
jgi:hypothetical protein